MPVLCLFAIVPITNNFLYMPAIQKTLFLSSICE